MAEYATAHLAVWMKSWKINRRMVISNESNDFFKYTVKVRLFIKGPTYLNEIFAYL